MEDLQIGREVELRTTVKKREGCKPQCKLKAKISKPTKTVVERRRIAAKVNKKKLLEDVSAKVCSELRKVSLKGHYCGSI